MKTKVFFVVLFVCLSVFALSSCAGAPDYLANVSEARYVLYSLNGESFTGEAYLTLRETPFIDDGKTGDVKSYLILRFVPTPAALSSEVTVSVGERSAELTFRAESEAYVATISAEDFDENKSILKYRAGDIYEEVSFNRLSGGEEQYKKILSTFVSQKSELLKSLEKEQFELRIRLMRRDEKNFWYVAIVTNEKTQCFLTDENGKIIAEKITKNNA